MKKILFLIFVVWIFNASAQTNNPDSLTEEKKNLIRIVGSLVKDFSKKALEEGRTDAGSKTVLGNAAKEILKGTARRSADKILKGGVDIRNGINLPGILEQKRDLFKQNGKEILLDNFQQSLKEAAQNALHNAVLKMAEKAIDFDVEDLVRFAGSDTMAITDVFKNAKRSTLVEVAKPIAKSAFKLAGGNKTFKKLKKAYNKLSDEKLDLNNEDLVAEKITDLFLDEMKAQEQQLKNNPLNLLDTLINIIKQ
jgi:uncharacterized membrane protein YheB (UPF0754 family)